MQVGGKPGPGGALDPQPDKAYEGFVVQEFDLDELRKMRLGCVVAAALGCPSDAHPAGQQSADLCVAQGLGRGSLRGRGTAL